MKKVVLILLMVAMAYVAEGQKIDQYLLQQGETVTRCSDEVFLRRAYISLTGKLPKPFVAQEFLASQNPKKREQLIQQLLNSDAYVLYFANLWGDMLRIKSEFPSNLWPNGVQAYNRWVYEKLTTNTPYDQMVRELLLSKGSNFREPSVNFFRAFPRKTPQNIYQNIHLLFLGERGVHDKGEQFFSQLRYKSTKEWKEEIIYVDYHLAPPSSTIVIDGKELPLVANEDWRMAYVNWLTDRANRRFAAVMANRIWYWVMGQGVVMEPDDWRGDNLPRNRPLLDYLTDRFVALNYDMKAFIKELTLSSAFQYEGSKSNVAFKTNRLNAEVMVDAISDITGLPDSYSSRVPEPFTFYPLGTHAVELGDATVSSTTLELFGRASRDVSLESQHIKGLNERQLLFLMNSSELEGKIRKSPSINLLWKNSTTAEELAQKVTILVLSRYPTPAEVDLYSRYAARQKCSLQQLCYDLVWMQINSTEFLFNH